MGASSSSPAAESSSISPPYPLSPEQLPMLVFRDDTSTLSGWSGEALIAHNGSKSPSPPQRDRKGKVWRNRKSLVLGSGGASSREEVSMMKSRSRFSSSGSVSGTGGGFKMGRSLKFKSRSNEQVGVTSRDRRMTAVSLGFGRKGTPPKTAGIEKTIQTSRGSSAGGGGKIRSLVQRASDGHKRLHDEDGKRRRRKSGEHLGAASAPKTGTTSFIPSRKTNDLRKKGSIPLQAAVRKQNEIPWWKHHLVGAAAAASVVKEEEIGGHRQGPFIKEERIDSGMTSSRIGIKQVIPPGSDWSEIEDVGVTNRSSTPQFRQHQQKQSSPPLREVAGSPQKSEDFSSLSSASRAAKLIRERRKRHENLSTAKHRSRSMLPPTEVFTKSNRQFHETTAVNNFPPQRHISLTATLGAQPQSHEKRRHHENAMRSFSDKNDTKKNLHNPKKFGPPREVRLKSRNSSHTEHSKTDHRREQVPSGENDEDVDEPENDGGNENDARGPLIKDRPLVSFQVDRSCEESVEPTIKKNATAGEGSDSPTSVLLIPEKAGKDSRNVDENELRHTKTTSFDSAGVFSFVAGRIDTRTRNDEKDDVIPREETSRDMSAQSHGKVQSSFHQSLPMNQTPFTGGSRGNGWAKRRDAKREDGQKRQQRRRNDAIRERRMEMNRNRAAALANETRIARSSANLTSSPVHEYPTWFDDHGTEVSSILAPSDRSDELGDSAIGAVRNLVVGSQQAPFGPTFTVNEEEENEVDFDAKFVEAVAAVVIQTFVRRFLAKNEARKRAVARTIIFSFLSRCLAGRKRLQFQNMALRLYVLAAIRIQAAFRGWWVRDCLSVDHYCATLVQRTTRGYLCRIQYNYDIFRINLAQSVVRCHLRLRWYKLWKQSASFIQAFYRFHRLATREHAALKIQTVWRAYDGQMNFMHVLADILIAQSVARRWLVLTSVLPYVKSERLGEADCVVVDEYSRRRNKREEIARRLEQKLPYTKDEAELVKAWRRSKLLNQEGEDTKNIKATQQATATMHPRRQRIPGKPRPPKLGTKKQAM